jgi:hypothetical protein
MKKGLLVSAIIFIAMPLPAQTLPYQPFPDSNAVWREHHLNSNGFCCCSGICLHEENYQYFLAGDTLINSLLYKKILKTGNGVEYITGPYTCPPWCNGIFEYFYFNDEYIGALRQDTAQKQVFYFDKYAQQEDLLYDFDLQLGDTLPLSLVNNSQNFVTKIDSIEIGNTFHNRYWLSHPGSSTNYAFIIEGIGGAFGLLSQLYESFFYSQSLICVQIDGVTVYPDTATTCQLASEIDESLGAPPFYVHPNPASTHLTIEHRSIRQGVAELYDAFGRLALQQNLEAEKTIIPAASLAPGLYILKTLTPTKKSAQMIIIQ